MGIDERDLIVLVLARQSGLIDDRRLAAACAAWSASGDGSLADCLVVPGGVASADREALDRAARAKLDEHGGDARAALAAVADGPAREAIRAAGVPALSALLDALPPPAGYVLVETLVKSAEHRSRYTLSRLHAEGGLGRVWLAHDEELNRDVALKELRPDRAGQAGSVRRFLAEAQVTGQLEHPNIVPVYELDRRDADGQPFYTMRFVRGRTMLAAILDYHGRRARGESGPLELRGLLQAFATVCQAIAYAHSRSVLHRDLKPENVVLGDFGEVIVLDWGLAKIRGTPEDPEAAPAPVFSEEARAEATGAGHTLGTPAYMAPEQAEGRSEALDERTDIYGLGAILFTILAGVPPHRGERTDLLLAQVASGPTPRARSVVATVPAALDAVCARAMTHQPRDRYAQAKELGTEVQRWLADEPVSAHRDSSAVRLGRWARKHRTGVAAAAVLLVVVTLGSLVGGGLVLREKERADLERDEAFRQRSRADESARAEATARAGADVQRDEALRQRGLADRAAAAESEARARAEHLLARQAVAQGVLRMDQGDLLTALPWFVAALRMEEAIPGRADVHRVRIGSVLRQIPKLTWAKGHGNAISHVAFSPDGRRVATVEIYGTHRPSAESDEEAPAPDFVPPGLRIWDTASGEVVVADLDGSFPGRRAVFSPDGTKLACFGGSSRAHVFDAASGRRAFPAVEISPYIADVAFSPDGRWFVGAGGESRSGPGGEMTGEAQVWDASTGTARFAGPIRHGAIVLQARFDPSGRRLVTASADRTARVWDATDGHPLTGPLPHDGPVTSAAFSPDGRRVVTGSFDRTARLWDAETGRPDGEALQAGGPVRVAAFSPDGLRVLVARSDPDPKIERVEASYWNAKDGMMGFPPYSRSDRVAFAVLSPDGRRVATAADGRARLWDVATGRPLGPGWAYEGGLRHLAVSPEGGRIALVTRSGGPDTERFITRVRVLDGETGGEVVVRHGPIELVNQAEFSPDGRRIVTASGRFGGAGAARTWSAETGEAAGFVAHTADPLFRAILSPDGSRVLAAGIGGARLFDGATAREVAVVSDRPARSASFSGDGRLAVVEGDREIFARDATTGRITTITNPSAPPLPRPIPAAPEAPARVAAAPPAPGAPPAPREVPPDEVPPAPAAPGGVPPAPADVPDAPPPPRSEPFVSLFFSGDPIPPTLSPDGRSLMLIEGYNGARARRYDAGSGRRDRATFSFSRPIATVAYHRGGALIATAGDSGTRVWDVSTAEPILAVLEADRARRSTFTADGRRLVVLGFTPQLVPPFGLKVSAPALTAPAPQAPASLMQPEIPPDGLMPWQATFSRDGRRVAVRDGETIRVIDVETRREVGPRLPGGDPIGWVDLDGDGRRVALGGGDRLARVWDSADLDVPSSPVALRREFQQIAWGFREEGVPCVGLGIDLRTWDISPAVATVDDLRGLAEVLSGISLDDRGIEDGATAERVESTRRDLATRDSGPFRRADPKSRRWHLAEAERAEVAGLWPRVDDHLGALLAAEPGRADLLARRARARDILGEESKADGDYAEAFRLDNEATAAFLRDEAEDGAASDRPEFAGRALRRLLEARPGDPRGLVLRARLAVEADRWPEAVASLAEAARAGPLDAADLAVLASLRLRTGDDDGYRSACAELDRRFGRDDDPATLRLVARACTLGPSAFDDRSRPLAVARRAIPGETKETDDRATLAGALLRAGRTAEADDLLVAAVRNAERESRFPNPTSSPRFLLWTGLARSRRGRIDDARRLFARASDLIKARENEPHFRAPGLVPGDESLDRVELSLLASELNESLNAR